MIINFFNAAVRLFIDMSFYIAIGLLFAGLLHIFVSKEFITKYVGGNNIFSVIKASLLGVPLPLCSCGVVPTAIFFKKHGASKPAMISFLISTPQTGVDSIIATYGMMGPFMAIYRPIAAFFSGIVGGLFISKADKSIVKDDIKTTCCSGSSCSTEHEYNKTEYGFTGKVKEMFRFAYVESLDDIAINFIIGIFISALIAVLVPDNYFSQLGISSGPIAMLLMIIIGIPMYICSTSSIPIAITLIMKGFSPGAAFVFLFAGPVTNAASISMLLKILGRKTVILYVFSVSIIAIIFGLILDFISRNINLVNSIINNVHHSNHGLNTLQITVAIIFAALLFFSLTKKLINNTSTFKIKVDGIDCNHCAADLKNKIKALDGVKIVKVCTESKVVTIQGKHLYRGNLVKAINTSGYKTVD